MCRVVGFMMPAMTPETLVVAQGSFDLEDPWMPPRGSASVPLRSAPDGGPPRLATSVTPWFDEQCLYVLFSAADDHVHATHREHDAPLYEEDVFEAFLAPEDAFSYYELEVNPLGTLFDARIESPEGVRATMLADRGWTCEGMSALIRAAIAPDGTRQTETLLRIPFASLGRAVPSSGERWRGNFFRIDRHPSLGDEYSAWQPTFRSPADFHVVAAFGTLVFQR